MVDAVLQKSEGLTFDVFKDPEPDENAEAPAEGEEVDQGPRHILVPEVVREPRIHFYKVPRLGSYLAIKLEYKSCLSTTSYDAGLKDYNTVKEKRLQQEQEIKEWEEQQLEKQEAASQGSGKSFHKEEKEWPEINPGDFQTENIQFVVCLNTLGQDREFTKEEVKFALDTVTLYKDQWEKIED